MNEQSKLLNNIKVLDLTSVVMGPYATQLLGDLGADVIKVEEPSGDMTRTVGPKRNTGMSSLFLGSNRNKKSITLNLKRKKSKEALLKLIKDSDIFIHNIRPQKIFSLGFGPNLVLKKNSKIIYAGLHGYGIGGPYEGMPAYDDVIQGQAGIAGTFISREKIPSLVPSVIADKSIALLASTSILAAYINRLKTGKGVYLEVSMFEGMVANTMIEHQYGSTFFPPIGEEGYPRVISNLRKPFKTKDGYICMLAYTNKQWNNFWTLTNNKNYKQDPRFISPTTRLKNINIIYRLVTNILKLKNTEEWLKILSKKEIPCGRVNKLKELKNDPHLKSLKFFRAFSHPSEGLLTIPDTGLKVNNKSLPIRKHQPKLGEHNEEVFTKLGYSKNEIKNLTEK